MPTNIAARRAAITQLGLLVIAACLSPALLRADTPACASTIAVDASFPSSSSYVCSDGYDYWLGFTDLGATTPGDSALPEGTMLHVDTLAPGTVAVTIEPGGSAQFLAGQTYSWSYDFVEASPGDSSFSQVGSDYGADFSNPTLVTTINALSVIYPSGIFSPTVGNQLGSLTLNNGALQVTPLSSVDGIQFVNTLSGIGQQTFIQSISNEISESSTDAQVTPEPAAVVLLAGGLVLLALIVRRSRVRA